MAISKHTHIRYNILDYCFRNKSFTLCEILYFLTVITIRTSKDVIKVFNDKEKSFGWALPENIKILDTHCAKLLVKAKDCKNA